MNTLTGNRDQVLQLLNNTIQKMQATPEEGAAASAGLGDEVDIVSQLNLGYMEEAARGAGAGAASIDFSEKQNSDWYVPRNRAVAVFQAAMDEFLEQENAPNLPAKPSGGAGAASTGEGGITHEQVAATTFYQGLGPGAGGAAAAALMEQYDNLDPRWLSWIWVKAKGWLKGKRPFIPHTSPTDFRFEMNDEATIAVVGDWGGGNAAAQAVANQIKAIKPDHIIHLGDVYYAGTEKETKERFLAYWPTPSEPGRSLALNSNHEMYGGGYGYFDITLPTFKQPASYFSLANKNWQFIGLDTGYDEHDLHDPQAEWLVAQLQD